MNSPAPSTEPTATETPAAEAPVTGAPVVPFSNHRESTVQFVRWALAQLQLAVEEAPGEWRLRLAETDQAHFAGQSELRLSIPNAGHSSASACVVETSESETDKTEAIELESHFGRWLMERLQSQGAAVPVRPAEHPIAVNDIAQRLFASYRVDGGRVHLGGCQLTDYPFLRLSFAAQANGRSEVRHVFVAHDGSSVPDRLVQDLGLLAIEPIHKRPPRIDETALEALINAGRRVATQSTTSNDPNGPPVQPAAIALVWVRHASGQLHFTIGETTVGLPFSGWAKLLKAQPYLSPLTGASSFHLAATDDGRIDVHEEIAACQQSGQRVLRQELVKCCVTGKLVLEQFTEVCPVSGQPCLIEAFQTCPNCRQRVSQLALQKGSCQACCQLKKIKKDDPRLVWILGEHTGLDRWHHWQLSETKSVYIGLAGAWLKRLLVVVDKETLAVHHLATGSRLHSTWSTVAGPEQPEILQ